MEVTRLPTEICGGLRLAENGATVYLVMTDLRQKLASLSANDKAELLDAVWESLESEVATLTEAQRTEIDRRLARHEANPSEVIPWDKVRVDLYNKP